MMNYLVKFTVEISLGGGAYYGKAWDEVSFKTEEEARKFIEEIKINKEFRKIYSIYLTTVEKVV